MDAISSDDESDAETISTDMVEYFRDISQYNLSINTREVCYNIRDHFKWMQA